MDLTREGLRRRITLSAFHELAAVDEAARDLGLANSLNALLLGRDNGDYYRRSGLALAWSPPSADRQTYVAMAFAERQRAAPVGTDFALRHANDEAWAFRPNLQADEGWDAGAGVDVSPWWGTDPRAPQGGVTASARWGVGDWGYRRIRVGGLSRVPFAGDWEVRTEAGAGALWGNAPSQRRFHVGGPSTLRGYVPLSRSGDSMLFLRGEVGRRFAFGGVSVFADGAWAGDRGAARGADALWSTGLGLRLADGLIRVDGAWALENPRGFRVEVVLDATH
jgi:hypothetical protein